MDKYFVFVEIDMRNDFADDPRAVLPVPGTYGLVGKMRAIEDLASDVVEVYDHHNINDPISQEEFKLFPPHCVPKVTTRAMRGNPDYSGWGHDRIAGLAKSDFKVPKNTYDFWKGMVGGSDYWVVELLKRFISRSC